MKNFFGLRGAGRWAWVRRSSRHGILVLSVCAVAACQLPEPYRTTSTRPEATAPTPNTPSVQTQPGAPPAPVAPAEPLPSAPPARERRLTPAAQALVAQAQKQTASGDYAVAAASIERALRIEPNSPQLWVELGKVRAAEGNYAQAENMARKALSMASGDAKSQSAAWQLLADSYRARGKTQEALDAERKANISLR